MENLFGTPLWSTVIHGLSEKVLTDGAQFKPNMNFFDIEGAGAKQLKQEVYKVLEPIFPNKKLEIYGRQNPIFPFGQDTPHHHPNCDLIGLFYAKVPHKSGDLLLHDTRGFVPLIWQQNVENGYTARSYHRIQPVEGLLVFFPSYVIHSVETNLSNDIRISIPMNINIR